MHMKDLTKHCKAKRLRLSADVIWTDRILQDDHKEI